MCRRLQLLAKILKTLLPEGAKFSLVHPVTSPNPFPLSMLFCYPNHIQNIGRQHSMEEGVGVLGGIVGRPVGGGNIDYARVGFGRECLNNSLKRRVE